MDTVSPEELGRIVREAVRQGFRDAGVYAETPEQQAETRLDFAFLRTMRKSRDVLGKGAGNALMALGVSGILALLWLGFKTKLGG